VIDKTGRGVPDEVTITCDAPVPAITVEVVDTTEGTDGAAALAAPKTNVETTVFFVPETTSGVANARVPVPPL
jgi:hypothetical protein